MPARSGWRPPPEAPRPTTPAPPRTIRQRPLTPVAAPEVAYCPRSPSLPLLAGEACGSPAPGDQHGGDTGDYGDAGDGGGAVAVTAGRRHRRAGDGVGVRHRCLELPLRDRCVL